MMAMQRGIAVYCEKPLCHTIGEARALSEMAAKSKAAAQMGNQGHCEDGYRRLCEFISAGVVGNITETHSWTDRANGGTGPRPKSQAAPKGMLWDSWIGPAPFRDFSAPPIWPARIVPPRRGAALRWCRFPPGKRARVGEREGVCE